MERQPVKSSNVESVGYNAEENILEIKFRNGGIYQYAGVQPEMYANLLEAESVGRFISHVVRGGRKGVKIEGDQGEERYGQ